MKQRKEPSLRGTPDRPKTPNITIYCLLFDDVVPMSVCRRRKKDLNTFGWNNCGGCTVGLSQQWPKQPPER